MRLRHPDGSLLHLAYCTNVHPADDLDGVAAQLERYAARGARAPRRRPSLGIGLWLAAPALADAAAAEAGCAAQLGARCGLEVVTLNGFPYKAFHAPGGQARRLPAATGPTPTRRDYTLGLARLLAKLLPDDVVRGHHLDPAARLARGLGRRGAGRRACVRWPTSPPSSRSLEAATGKRIRLALEPEPGCVGRDHRAGAVAALGGLAPDWIGVCLEHLPPRRAPSRTRRRPSR